MMSFTEVDGVIIIDSSDEDDKRTTSYTSQQDQAGPVDDEGSDDNDVVLVSIVKAGGRKIRPPKRSRISSVGSSTDIELSGSETETEVPDEPLLESSSRDTAVASEKGHVVDKRLNQWLAQQGSTPPPAAKEHHDRRPSSTSTSTVRAGGPVELPREDRQPKNVRCTTPTLTYSSDSSLSSQSHQVDVTLKKRYRHKTAKWR